MSNKYKLYVGGLLFIVVALNLCDRTIISIMVDEIRRDLHLTDRQLGFAMGLAFTIPHLLMGIPLARAADRYSRKIVAAASMLGWSLMTILSGQATSFLSLVIARAGVSIGEAGGNPPVHSLLMDLSTPAYRSKAMSIVPIAGLIGMGAGLFYGGWANDRFGWRLALVYAGLAGIAFSILFQLTVKEPARSESSAVARRVPLNESSVLGVLKYLFSLKSMCLLIAGACLVSIVSVGKYFWEPTFLRRVYGLSAQAAGFKYLFLAPLPSIAGAFVGAALADHFGKDDARWYAYFASASILASAPFVMGFYLCPAGAMLGGIPLGFYLCACGSFLGASWSAGISVLAQYLVPSSVRAVTAATWTMIAAFTGNGLGPFLVGDLNNRLAPAYGSEAIRYSLLTVSGSLVLAAVAFFWLGRTVPPEREAR